MVGRITPVYIVKPSGMLGWDGTNFYALKVDTAGNLVLGSKLESGDQLFSYKESVTDRVEGTPSGAGGYITSGSVPPGKVWVITNICASDLTGATTIHRYRYTRAGTAYHLCAYKLAFAAADKSNWTGNLYLIESDTVRVDFIGCGAGDICNLTLSGYSMTKV